jgi:hypothetical protein
MPTMTPRQTAGAASGPKSVRNVTTGRDMATDGSGAPGSRWLPAMSVQTHRSGAGGPTPLRWESTGRNVEEERAGGRMGLAKVSERRAPHVGRPIEGRPARAGRDGRPSVENRPDRWSSRRKSSWFTSRRRHDEAPTGSPQRKAVRVAASVGARPLWMSRRYVGPVRIVRGGAGAVRRGRRVVIGVAPDPSSEAATADGQVERSGRPDAREPRRPRAAMPHVLPCSLVLPSTRPWSYDRARSVT